MPEFTHDTPGSEVVTAYADRIPGKTSESLASKLVHLFKDLAN